MTNPHSRPLDPPPLSEPAGGQEAAEAPGPIPASAVETVLFGEGVLPLGGAGLAAGLEPNQGAFERLGAQAAIRADGLSATDRPNANPSSHAHSSAGPCAIAPSAMNRSATDRSASDRSATDFNPSPSAESSGLEILERVAAEATVLDGVPWQDPASGLAASSSDSSPSDSSVSPEASAPSSTSGPPTAEMKDLAPPPAPLAPPASPPAPPAAPPGAAAENDDDAFPGEVEMTLVDHLEELRRRLLRSLLALLIAAAGCLLAVKPLVRLLEVPAQGIRFLQLAPGEFLFVSLKVAGYAGLVLALPWILFESLAWVLPGLTRRERRLVAPAVAGSSLLFLAGLAFAWWALVPAALRFLVSYGADVVEPLWSIERYLDFVLLLMVATALAFQLPVLQLLLGALGILDAVAMLAAWRWVVLVSALAGAVLTPSTDPVTMLLLSGAITALYLIGVGLVALVGRRRPDRA
jgi:sec-independent protein translocase protein TatC